MVLRHGCSFLSKKLSKTVRNFARQHAPVPKLTPQEVTKILQTNEFTKEFNDNSSVKSYDTNQLASNNPIEDMRSEARCKLTNGFLFGIFDGHGGNECSQVISKRLFYYIAACLLPTETLKDVIDTKKSPVEFKKHLLDTFNDNAEFVTELGKLYNKSYLSFIEELTKLNKSDFEIELALEHAFLRLDQDLSAEAFEKLDRREMARTLSVAMSGSVAIVAHIDGPHLHVANVGDCQAVLGVHTENEGWSAQLMSREHNVDNSEEVKRILSEHPESEKNTVIKMERLLGQLAPLRALGDFRYKWTRDIMNKIVVPYFGETAIPPNYHTPPYLTAKPQTSYHKLTPKNKFLILASDGLWDLMTPLEAVHLVGEHMTDKVATIPLPLSTNNLKLSQINEILIQRKESFKKKPLDDNAATHLLRNALGGTEYGIDHLRLSKFLTLPNEVVRIFRDDITITVVYINSEFL
ncbi:pyruvate dehydrogenase [acetyl-transferring]-phosphatase 1, mitochondrial [Microplitis mediator]|uniref:pyruvate dehydrogenase [acetyl-transferring]-phosphatase 1, mitochondrial n=1 Tax=Microplitis mediator TaxID=375433 RepID=UPI002552AD4A|nr:pyruvate dehydrogenase [acetyl-transferring]-phosphatase 1, mitochondrial [Microplitis mediator]